MGVEYVIITGLTNATVGYCMMIPAHIVAESARGGMKHVESLKRWNLQSEKLKTCYCFQLLHF
jgi:hypothetical protein